MCRPSVTEGWRMVAWQRKLRILNYSPCRLIVNGAASADNGTHTIGRQMTTILGVAEAVFVRVRPGACAAVLCRSMLGLAVSADFGDACFLQTGQHSTIILFDLVALEKRVSVIPHMVRMARTHCPGHTIRPNSMARASRSRTASPSNTNKPGHKGHSIYLAIPMTTVLS